MLRTALFTAGALASLAAFATPALADGLRVHQAAARLVVIPENRSDVAVSFSGGDSRLPPLRTHMDGGVLVVDGGLEHRIGACGSFGVNWNLFKKPADRAPSPVERVEIRGIGPLSVERLPVITARVPMNAAVAADGAVWGEVGPTAALRLSTAGCGDWRVADVRGPLELSTAGSGDVAAHRLGALRAQMTGSSDLSAGDIDRDADLSVAGSGGARLGRVAGRLGLRIGGSGDVTAARGDGPVDATVGGSGNVNVKDGHSPSLSVSVAGSGGFIYGGVAGSLRAEVAGSGDVQVAQVTGPVSKAVAGSGDIHIGR